MKALTICQPYADLILLPESHEDYKRAENRSWFGDYRGPLLIHAGKSREWLGMDDDPTKMVFGAIIGQVECVACYHVSAIQELKIPSTFHWLKHHRHVEGPWCHIFMNPVRLEKPIPCRGALGYFAPPADILSAIATANTAVEQRSEKP